MATGDDLFGGKRKGAGEIVSGRGGDEPLPPLFPIGLFSFPKMDGSLRSRVTYHGDTSHFFGIGISRCQIQPVWVFFGRYYRGFGKIGLFFFFPWRLLFLFDCCVVPSQAP